jgi:hypothetical protein
MNSAPVEYIGRGSPGRIGKVFESTEEKMTSDAREESTTACPRLCERAFRICSRALDEAGYQHGSTIMD